MKEIEKTSELRKAAIRANVIITWASVKTVDGVGTAYTLESKDTGTVISIMTPSNIAQATPILMAMFEQFLKSYIP
jgi:hypothetical protein